MIQSTSNQLYVGISQNPTQRLLHHNTRQGARFTKQSSDFAIVFLEQHGTLKEARGREVQIKKWRREKKDMLVMRYQQSLPTKQTGSGQ